MELLIRELMPTGMVLSLPEKVLRWTAGPLFHVGCYPKINESHATWHPRLFALQPEANVHLHCAFCGKKYTTNLDPVDEMLVLWADEGVPCVGRIHVQPKVFTCTHLAKLVYVVKGAARGCTQGSAHLRDTKLKSCLGF